MKNLKIRFRKLPLIYVRYPSVPSYPLLQGRSILNAPNHSKHLGLAKITHPFHPYSGQSFKILKTRTVGGTETLILQETDRGSFAVHREWTDKAELQLPYQYLHTPVSILSFQDLLSLTELIDQLKQNMMTNQEKRLDK